MITKNVLHSVKIFRQIRFQCCLQTRSLNSSAVVSDQMPFHLVNSYVHVGCASLWRRIMDPFYRELYRQKYEPNYSDEKFLNGAKQAFLLSSLLIREKKFHELSPIMSKPAVECIKESAGKMPDDLLFEKLGFCEDDIVKAYILSSFFSCSKLAVPQDAEWTFYGTVVLVIDKTTSDKKRSMRKLLKSPNTLVCNVTLARIVIPLGRWMITSINIADAEHVNRQESSVI